MIPIEEEMRGKVAIVTGGNTGIGFGCAKVFCQAGMRVVIAARRKEKGEAAAAELNAMGKGECVFFQCDVSDPDQVKAWWSLPWSGTAGWTPWSTTPDTTPSIWTPAI